MAELEWEHDNDDLTKSLQKAKEEIASLKNALAQEVNIIVTTLLNELLQRIISELDHSEQHDSNHVNEPKMKRKKLI
jgi:hypothetical protein